MADAARAAGDPTGRREVAGQMTEAAARWLDALGEEQRTVATGPVPADDGTDAGRRRWFYTPTDHGGLTVHQQRPAQQQALMRLVATGLSTAGYVTVATILGLENVLDHVEGFSSRVGRERGRDPGLYYLRIFGRPGGRQPWGWRFGGHHVSLNYLVVDGAVAATTPCFLGANPAASALLGEATSRPLGRVEDVARELVRSLRPELAARAVVSSRAPSDIVTGNRTTVQEEMPAVADPAATFRPVGEPASGDGIGPRGLAGEEMDLEQRAMLRVLLGTYLNRVPAGVSPMPRYEDDRELDAVHLAWAGSTAPGEAHYYRLQGPGLLAEWDNTQDGANHAHSVWRDPSADFGLDVLARHRAAHHG